MATSRAVIGLAAILIIIGATFAVYAAVTYPRAILTIPVSFTAGADVTNTPFDQQSLNSMVEVQVSVQSGVALWRARILSGGNVVWEHAAGQGEQQSYSSGWIALTPDTYNFSFGIKGGTSLEATVTVSSKGRFW